MLYLTKKTIHSFITNHLQSDAPAAGHDPDLRAGPKHPRRPHSSSAAERLLGESASLGRLVFGARRHCLSHQNKRLVAEG
jgi:hypothetical protein